MSILYAPENIVLRQLMDVVQPIIFPVRISGVNSTYDLESSLIQESAFAGIEFPESFWVSLKKFFTLLNDSFDTVLISIAKPSKNVTIRVYQVLST